VADIGEVRRGLRQFCHKIATSALNGADVRSAFYIAPAIVYTIAIAFYYLMYGGVLDYLPAVAFLGAVLTITVLSYRRKMGRYWVSIISIMLSYEALQSVVGSLAVTRGITSLYPLDSLLWGFNLTGWVQSTFESPAVTAIASTFYSLHVPLIVATCLIVWYVKRPLFGKYVTVMIITTYAALMTFILMPTAPPWYAGVANNLYQTATSSALPQGLVSFMSLVEVDQFAAFPSLHGAYAIIFSYFMIKIDRRLALISLPITFGILFSTLYLGQHYLIDLIGGALYALIPCAIAERFQLNIPGSRQTTKQ
jgi:membrane-associated phospholipid phosphatase